MPRSIGIFPVEHKGRVGGVPGSLLAHRRTERRPRGPRDRRARSPLDRAGDMIGRAGHELGVAPVEMQDDHGPVVGEHVA